MRGVAAGTLLLQVPAVLSCPCPVCAEAPRLLPLRKPPTPPHLRFLFWTLFRKHWQEELVPRERRLRPVWVPEAAAHVQHRHAGNDQPGPVHPGNSLLCRAHTERLPELSASEGNLLASGLSLLMGADGGLDEAWLEC